jgi:hypothetical protein
MAGYFTTDHDDHGDSFGVDVDTLAHLTKQVPNA